MCPRQKHRPPCPHASSGASTTAGWGGPPSRCASRQAAVAQRLAKGQAEESALGDEWAQRPNLNVGVAMGKHSGLLGLDIDGADGKELLAKWVPASMPRTDRLLDAQQWRTLPVRLARRHGGQDQVMQEGQEGSDQGPGDRRKRSCRPAFTPMAASMPASGCAPGEVDAAPCPEWLRQQLLRRAEPERAKPPSPSRPPSTAPVSDKLPQRARNYLAKMEVCDPRPEDGMDASEQLLKAATAAHIGFDLPEDTAVMLVMDWDRSNPCGPYPEAEVRRKCRDARRIARSRPAISWTHQSRRPRPRARRAAPAPKASTAIAAGEEREPRRDPHGAATGARPPY